MGVEFEVGGELGVGGVWGDGLDGREREGRVVWVGGESGWGCMGKEDVGEGGWGFGVERVVVKGGVMCGGESGGVKTDGVGVYVREGFEVVEWF